MSGKQVRVEELREQHQRLAEEISKGRMVPGISSARADRLRSPAFVELMAAKRAGARDTT